jgi:hypothetical protein
MRTAFELKEWTISRNCYSNRLTGEKKLKIEAKFASIFVAACILVF